MEKNVKNIAGVSLVEVMIAMFLVSLLLIAIVAVFPRMSGHGKQISDADRARLIAMEVIEEIQDYTRFDITYTGCISTTGSDFENIAGGPVEVGPVTFTVTIADPNCDDVNTINVTVSWQPSGNSRRSSITVTGAIK